MKKVLFAIAALYLFAVVLLKADDALRPACMPGYHEECQLVAGNDGRPMRVCECVSNTPPPEPFDLGRPEKAEAKSQSLGDVARAFRSLHPPAFDDTSRVRLVCEDGFKGGIENRVGSSCHAEKTESKPRLAGKSDLK